MEIEWIGSPNKEKGRRGYRPEAVVIHIMDGVLSGNDSWFRSPESKVSAHYGIGDHGDVHQYVAETDTAWHAGRTYRSSWTLLKPGINPNLYTIGIEHEGQADTPWSDEMLRASIQLVAELCNRWSIETDRDHVVGHREIYARKSCPGNWLDLSGYASQLREAVLRQDFYNFFEQLGIVTARVDLNLRREAPTTEAPVARIVPKGTSVRFLGWTSNGLTVNGNAHWYRTEDGNYVWAGATTHPVPGRG